MDNNCDAWIDAVRVQMYKDTEHMTIAERVAYSNAEGRRIAEQYGLTSLLLSHDAASIYLQKEQKPKHLALE